VRPAGRTHSEAEVLYQTREQQMTSTVRAGVVDYKGSEP
jgi:hypothetical protein